MSVLMTSKWRHFRVSIYTVLTLKTDTSTELYNWLKSPTNHCKHSAVFNQSATNHQSWLGWNAFSRAWLKSLVFTSFDWFFEPSAFVAIGQTDFFGFSLNRVVGHVLCKHSRNEKCMPSASHGRQVIAFLLVRDFNFYLNRSVSTGPKNHSNLSSKNNWLCLSDLILSTNLILIYFTKK